MTCHFHYRALTLLLAALTLHAQIPSFEVASIKPNTSGQLETSKGPVEIIVIDNIEKPTDN